jgi:hypothetical protein
MRAINVGTLGGPDVLELVEVDRRTRVRGRCWSGRGRPG